VHVPDDCGQRVIGDWSSDGRVGQGYPLACYRAALRSLPEDVLQYSSADEEIRRALALARQARSEQASTTRTETGASRTAGTAAALPAPAVPATAPSPALPYPVAVLAAVALALLGVAAAGLLTATRRRARG
jgi:hypothetical protein